MALMFGAKIETKIQTSKYFVYLFVYTPQKVSLYLTPFDLTFSPFFFFSLKNFPSKGMEGLAPDP